MFGPALRRVRPRPLAVASIALHRPPCFISPLFRPTLSALAFRCSSLSAPARAPSASPPAASPPPPPPPPPALPAAAAAFRSAAAEAADELAAEAAAAAPAAAAAAAAPAPARPPLTAAGLLAAYAELSKARLSALVVFTSGAGYLMAGAPASWPALCAAVVGTSLAAASAGALNQVWEAPLDARMRRTAGRPLPSGRLSRAHALAFGGAMAAASVTVLAAGANALTAALGAGTIALYVLVYTPLKTRSTLNTAVGAVVGAVPPLMGWAAATGGTLAFEPLLLGAALAAWQLPHFYALAWGLRRDYARGGFAMAPVRDTTGGRATAWLALRGALALAAVPPAAALLGVTSAMFAVEGAALNAVLLRLALRFHREPSDASARALFRASLWYLPLLLALMVFHSRHWHADADAAGAAAAAAEELNARDLSELAARGMAQLHAWGRAACIHEVVVRQHVTQLARSADSLGRDACRLLFQSFGGPKAAAAAAQAAAPAETIVVAEAASGARGACPVVVVEEAAAKAAVLATAAAATAAERRRSPSSAVQ